MNLFQLSELLRASLERALGSAQVHLGPPQVGDTPDRQPEIYVIAVGYEDFGGVTLEGSQISLRPLVVDSQAKGFAEERPGRLVVEVLVLALDYQQMHKLCGVIAIQTLRVLESAHVVILSEAPKKGGHMRFTDFHTSLFNSKYSSEPLAKRQPYSGKLIFHLDGFLHVQAMQPDPR